MECNRNHCTEQATSRFGNDVLCPEHYRKAKSDAQTMDLQRAVRVLNDHRHRFESTWEWNSALGYVHVPGRGTMPIHPIDAQILATHYLTFRDGFIKTGEQSVRLG
jgi:hypothetical protein